MVRFREWRPRTVGVVLAVWAIAGAAGIVLYVQTWATQFAKSLNDWALASGATSANLRIDAWDSWPQELLIYAVVVLLPAGLVLLYWRRARAATAARVRRSGP
jgi:hypothetical protein